MPRIRQSAFAFTLPLVAWASLSIGCDKRSEKEKGQDYAHSKLDFVQGAADVLKEQGGKLGKTAGEGVGDLVKGVGTGVKDVIYPPVSVALGASVKPELLAIERANEAASDGETRVVETSIRFKQAFHGKLTLHAADEKGAQQGVGTIPNEIDVLAGAVELVRFSFPGSMRLSHVKGYRLEAVAPLSLVQHESAAALKASQLVRVGPKASLYIQFPGKFAGKLELRAYAPDGSELGRAATDALKQALDTAGFFEFNFDARAHLDNAAKYELRKL